MEDNAMDAGAEAPQMTFFQRLGSIFFEPSKTFADINRKPSWLGIFLIIAILSTIVAYVMVSHLDLETMMRAQMAGRNLTEEQVNAAMSSPFVKYSMYFGVVVAPIGQLVAFLAIAGIFLLLYIMMGTPLTYKKSLAVTAWGMSPPAMLYTILTVILVYAKNMMITDPNEGIVMSNLGILVDKKANPVLGSLLTSIDLFTIWTIVLLSIGFAAISSKKMTTKKAAIGVVILWLLVVLGKAGYKAIART
jgi:hypothetical protein